MHRSCMSHACLTPNVRALLACARIARVCAHCSCHQLADLCNERVCQLQQEDCGLQLCSFRWSPLLGEYSAEDSLGAEHGAARGAPVQPSTVDNGAVGDAPMRQDHPRVQVRLGSALPPVPPSLFPLCVALYLLRRPVMYMRTRDINVGHMRQAGHTLPGARAR
jgi:hypothetical protein